MEWVNKNTRRNYDWWRCLDLNQGLYGYEPYALTN